MPTAFLWTKDILAIIGFFALFIYAFRLDLVFYRWIEKRKEKNPLYSNKNNGT
jgi:hypothetical protein